MRSLFRSKTLIVLLTAIIMITVASVCARAQSYIKKTTLVAWNGYTWQYLQRGDILRSRFVLTEDFLGYSNGTTGIGILAASSAPDNTNCVTLQDWYWGSAYTGGGSVKLKAAANGTVVIDTAHAAQNDDATLSWREANFSIAKNPSMEVLLKINSLTNCIFEFGWYTANDYIVIRFNPAVSATKWLIYTNKAGGGDTLAYTLTKGPIADTYVNFKIAVTSTGGAKIYMNGSLMTTLPAATITTTAAIVPRFYAKVTDAGHAATKTMTLDFVRLTQDR